MKIVFFISLLFVFTISSISAEENENSNKNEWIIFTDRSDNRLINEIIEQSDLTDKINIIKKLGLRKDRDFSSLLEFHYYNNKSTHKKELILYYYISSIINTNEDYIINKIVIDDIFLNIDKFTDSLLRKEIIIKSDYADKRTAVKILASEGRMIADLSRENRYLDPLMIEEIRIYFRHSENYNSPVLNQLSDIIYRNTVNLDYN